MSPNGDDHNLCGSPSSDPCKTINVAITNALSVSSAPNGIRILLRGGNYYGSVSIGNFSGSTNRPLIIEGYNNEIPRFYSLSEFRVYKSTHVHVCDIEIRSSTGTGVSFRDSSSLSLQNALVYSSSSNGIDWIRISNSEMKNIEVAKSLNKGIYLYESNNNHLADINTKKNNGSGLNLVKSSHNKIENISSSYNFDTRKNGENADGISISSGSKNSIVGCSVWYNDDDGIDTWESTENFISNCSSAYNGTLYVNTYRPAGTRNLNGDGNGYKLGPGGYNRVINSKSYGNSTYGYTKNRGEGNSCINNRSDKDCLGKSTFSRNHSCYYNIN